MVRGEDPVLPPWPPLPRAAAWRGSSCRVPQACPPCMVQQNGAAQDVPLNLPLRSLLVYQLHFLKPKLKEEQEGSTACRVALASSSRSSLIITCVPTPLCPPTPPHTQA